ncbi:protein regulator of cytokinesis 1 [Drosophila bipectinata]|uniref:protein regulator of cytokinesis 1 n=1 Tax=Drosophila bipectinata TaxID=42026 RepID=UPI001C89B1B8|nr:protein regulator of cytokinesis 1 [Drosophila bipectinata]
MNVLGSPTAIKAKILEMTGEHVDQLHVMWSHIFEPKTCHEFLLRLKDHADSFYTDLLNESREKQQGILDEISGLRAEASNLTRLLHESVDIGDRPDDMPLVLWQLKLDKSIEHLREELARRRAEICELLLQQEQLCEELGELPLPLLDDPLPTPEEMDCFRGRLDQLREQRVRRVEEMNQLRQSIKHDMKLLECLPQTDSEERLLNQVNHMLTPETFERLRRMQKEFADQVKELRERIDDMREKIHVLWERLQESDEYAKRRVRESTAYNQRTYDVLREELQRCQALRRQNLKTFIEQLRIEIKEMWDLTLKSQQERMRFSNFYNDWYNEDLLELHELELDDLKSFYNKNKGIFELYESRAELWARMEALEAKASEPNRFNNRGGQLLKEEKERKAITSKLPKIEQQITELVQAFEAQENTPFLVHGENILERMAEDWERHRQSKQQSSARKKTPAPSSASKFMPPPAPGSVAPRTPRTLRNMSTLSSSTMSLRKTPSQQYLRPHNITKSTGNLHKRLHPPAAAQPGSKTPSAKRSLMSSLNSIKASPALRSPAQRLLAANQNQSQLKSTKSPLKRVRVLDNTLRRSGGLGTSRRSIGTRSSKKMRTRESPQRAGTEETDYTTDENNENGDTYEEFQPPSRSSMLPRMRHQLALPRKRQMAATMKQQHQQLTEEPEQPEPRFNLPSPRESMMLVPRRDF